ncbi:MAG: peptidylprolyl isomerase [Melioribacteraceae bacterium]|nr:peptidylprolyl isomerase [Melioribacteraceae bacterium]
MRKYLFVSLIFIQQLLFAQYTERDYKLVQSTFFRDFNDNIFINYLNSDDTQKANAALLSIAHSSDTNFVQNIIRLDYQKHSSFLFFALGKLGYTKQSIQYLKSKISPELEKEELRELLFAIGRIGSEEDLNFLIETYGQKNQALISATLLQFVLRGIRTNDKKEIDFLVSNLDNDDPDERFYSLYSLYRIGGSEKAIPRFEKLLSSETTSDILFTLANLRRMKSFPFSNDLAEKIIKHKDWSVRVEAARTLAFFYFTTEIELLKYLELLNDSNPNVSRQAAQSISEITMLDSEIDLNNLLLDYLTNGNLTVNSLGELAVSYAKLFNNEVPKFIEIINKKIDDGYLFQIAALHPDKQWKLKFFIENYPKLESRNAHSYISSFLSLQKDFEDNQKFSEFVIDLIEDDSPIINAITVSFLDSAFLTNNSKFLKELLTRKIINNKDKAGFSEAVPIFAKTFEKISKHDSKNIFEILAESSVPSIAKFANSKLGKPHKSIQPSQDYAVKFDEFFACAFDYRSAVVITNKGEFEIDLLPEFAPITVGNFIYLAKRGYFNGVPFHRVVPNFVIQTGDRTGTGWGGPGYEIKSEFSFVPFKEGYVGMASAGVDTEGSQWFVMHSYAPHLNGSYTNFAKVLGGMETINNIDLNDKILEIKLVE